MKFILAIVVSVVGTLGYTCYQVLGALHSVFANLPVH